MAYESNPIAIGAVYAVLAAIAFGLATPFIQRFGTGLGPFTTACLLYVGAALGALPNPWRRHADREPPVRWTHVRRLAAVAFFGAALAPTLFAWGLQRVPATDASLLLNAEAVFTVGLAAIFYREHVGRRVLLAVAFMFAGGSLAVAGSSSGTATGPAGALAIIAAVLCWAMDNTLTRPLADLDPSAVVRRKALLGLLLNCGIALVRQEPFPGTNQVIGLLACGVTGYGLSLRFYLLAQRRIGAGRTGSVFALAPFLGAVAAALMGDRSAGWATLAAGLLFGLGVILHLTEKHRHPHLHQTTTHDHAHRHDDGHHDHAHETCPEGMHSHPHEHAAVAHAHPHGPDLHHEHQH